MKIIVCGSRSFDDYLLLRDTLDKLTAKLDKKKLMILHGGAEGADKLASRWCDKNFVTYQIYRPDYKKYKLTPKVAPIKRNEEMVSQEGVGLVVAFWNGISKGTANTIELAEQKGLKVKIVKYEEEDVE